MEFQSGVIGGKPGSESRLEIDRHVLLKREDFQAEFPGEDFRGVTAKADFKGRPVVEIVIEEPAIEKETGDIAGVADSQDRVGFHIQPSGQADRPRGGMLVIRF